MVPPPPMASALPLGYVAPFDPARHHKLIPYMAALHAAGITGEGPLSTFAPPITLERRLKWWHARIAEMAAGERVIFLLIEWGANPSDPPGELLAGLVMLSLRSGLPSETGPHRAVVETLLVAAKYRRRGGAKLLMRELEAEALRRGKYLLLCDAMTHKDNQKKFEGLGFIKAGTVPGFALDSEGKVRDSELYYKHIQP
jgi:ribosomal protein S18 acetylase RimI-like enzyme